MSVAIGAVIAIGGAYLWFKNTTIGGQDFGMLMAGAGLGFLFYAAFVC